MLTVTSVNSLVRTWTKFTRGTRDGTDQKMYWKCCYQAGFDFASEKAHDFTTVDNCIKSTRDVCTRRETNWTSAQTCHNQALTFIWCDLGASTPISSNSIEANSEFVFGSFQRIFLIFDFASEFQKFWKVVTRVDFDKSLQPLTNVNRTNELNSSSLRETWIMA